MKRAERKALALLGVGAARLHLADLVHESFRSLGQHPLRSVLTALGTMLGATAFVASLGLTSTITRQVSDRFDANRATEVVVRPAADTADRGWLTDTALQRLTRLGGVVAAGRRLTGSELEVRREASPGGESESVRVMGVDPAALSVVEPAIRSGRVFDEFHESGREPVALLAAPIAERIGIIRAGPAVFIDGRAYTVMGIYDDVARREETMLAALIPYSMSHQALQGEADADVVVEAAPGAAGVIARQAPLALSPGRPELLQAVAPPDPGSFRRSVEGDVTRLSFILTAVALIIGMVSIANSATAAIVTRVPEIGLRRALGARPRHVFIQLVGETAALGALGGVVGAVLGVAATVLISIGNGWQPVIDLRLAAVASLGGGVAGALAGLAPAVRATRIQPVAALQR